MLCTAAVNPNVCPPVGHVRAPERVPEAASGWLRGLTVPVDHRKLIACSSGLCVTAEHGRSMAAWPAPRPRLTCGLGSSGSSHVSCECPHRSGPGPLYCSPGTSESSCLPWREISCRFCIGLDRARDPSCWVRSKSFHRRVSRAVLFQDENYLFFNKKNLCSTDPRSENWAMFAGVAFSFLSRRTGNDSWILLPDNNAVISLSFQPILTRQK